MSRIPIRLRLTAAFAAAMILVLAGAGLFVSLRLRADLDEKLGADAQFAVKPRQYDVLVRAGGAEQWLKDVTVTAGAVASNDVLFDFAPLTVSDILAGATPTADVVVYPAGERVRFAGFATGNPVRFLLPAGRYDVEVATTDGAARKRVEGVEVRGGLETTQTIDLAQP